MRFRTRVSGARIPPEGELVEGLDTPPQVRRCSPPRERGQGQRQIVAGGLVPSRQKPHLGAVGARVDVVGLGLEDGVVGTFGLIKGAVELQADAPAEQHGGVVLGPEEAKQVVKPQGVAGRLGAGESAGIPQEVGAIGRTQPQ